MQSPILNVMTAAAIKAGKGLMRDFGEVDQLHVSKKGPANFVTEADIRTETLLRKELSKARPDYGFLLEEGGEVAGKDGIHRWIIDPLDGTTNFIHAIPYFCTSIGLEKHENGKSDIIAGVIFNPMLNELYTAEKGKGAFLNDRRITVSMRAALADSLLISGTPRPKPEGPDVFALSKALRQSGATVRDFGAAALDLANVAAGRADACWLPAIQPWDIAAGILLVREAGGMATQLDGQPATAYSSGVLAGNKAIYPALHKLLSETV
jgi:myo-inositol-1(or 4)-monophosphatase